MPKHRFLGCNKDYVSCNFQANFSILFGVAIVGPPAWRTGRCRNPPGWKQLDPLWVTSQDHQTKLPTKGLRYKLIVDNYGIYWSWMIIVCSIRGCISTSAIRAAYPRGHPGILEGRLWMGPVGTGVGAGIGMVDPGHHWQVVSGTQRPEDWLPPKNMETTGVSYVSWFGAWKIWKDWIKLNQELLKRRQINKAKNHFDPTKVKIKV